MKKEELENVEAVHTHTHTHTHTGDLKNKNGITLVSLVVTIIILLILAGIIIAPISKKGLLEKAKLAKEEQKNAQVEEDTRLVDYENIIAQYVSNSRKIGEMTTEELTTLIRTVVKQELSASSSGDTNPTGTIIAYSVDDVPNGYLKCEGQAISRTNYSNLFNIIGTTYGEGDGSTTFNIPDLRGEFLRGTGINSHVDSGNGANVGVHQSATKHVYIGYNSEAGDIWMQSITKSNDSSVSLYTEYADNYLINQTSGLGAYWKRTGTFSGSLNQAYITSRPTNTSVLYCIKY